MTKYVCTKCGKPQYTANTKCNKPCMYCGSECKKED